MKTQYQKKKLPEPEFKHRLVHIAAQQVDGPVVLPHNLPGQGKANAGAFFFGGVERDKNLLLGRDRNGLAIVGHLDHHIVLLAHPGSNVDVLRPGLQWDTIWDIK